MKRQAKALFLTATLLATLIMTLSVDARRPSNHLNREDLESIESNEKNPEEIMEIIDRLTRQHAAEHEQAIHKQQNYKDRIGHHHHRRRRHHEKPSHNRPRHHTREEEMVKEGKVGEGDNRRSRRGQPRVIRPLRAPPVRIQSEEEGKKFLRKHCRNGKCHLMKAEEASKTFKEEKPASDPGNDDKDTRHNHKTETRDDEAKKTFDHHKRKGTSRKAPNRKVKVIVNSEAQQGLDALEKSKERTQAKYTQHYGKADRGQPRDDRPIHPWQAVGEGERNENGNTRKGPIKRQVIWSKLRQLKGEENPALEVNQINLHIDVDVKQQQAQQEQQAIAKEIHNGAEGHPDNNCNHHHHPGRFLPHGHNQGQNHKGHHQGSNNNNSRINNFPNCRITPKSGYEVLQPPPSRRAVPRTILAITSLRAPVKRGSPNPSSLVQKAEIPQEYGSMDEDNLILPLSSNHPYPPTDTIRSKHPHHRPINCSYENWAKSLCKRTNQWRRRFSNESTGIKAALVLALAAIVTMQVLVLGKFLAMMTQYVRLPTNDDDDNQLTNEKVCGSCKSRNHHRDRLQPGIDAPVVSGESH